MGAKARARRAARAVDAKDAAAAKRSTCRRCVAPASASILAGAFVFGLPLPFAQAAGPTISFSAGTQFGASNPQAVATADLDGDGNLDLVTANYSDASVDVLLGAGDGSFGAPVNYPTGAGGALNTNASRSVAVGDLSGDGVQDIVVASLDDTVRVLLGAGDGTFSAASGSPFPGTTLPRDVALGDLDGDGNLDVVTGSNYYDYATSEGRIGVMLGDGVGGLGAATSFSNGPNYTAASVALGDLDGDDDLDIVSGNFAPNGASVLLGEGNGTFGDAVAYRTSTSGAAGVAVGDLDGDGYLDVVTGNQDNDSVSVLPGNGQGALGLADEVAAGNGPMGVALGDLNGDGLLDIATSTRYGSSLGALTGDGGGTFEANLDFPAGQFGYSIALGDFSGDGRLDAVTAGSASGEVSVLLNTTEVAAPTVASVSPSSGPTAGGTSVTITGTDLTGATAVTFAGTPATSFTVDSATQITAVSPAGSAGPTTVEVTTPGGSVSSAFTYSAAPTVASVSPSSGPTAGGTSVTITGTDLTGATAVTFAGAPATSFTVDSATQITAVSPAGSAGATTVEVTTPGGSASSAFTYTGVTPSTLAQLPVGCGTFPSRLPTAGTAKVRKAGCKTNAGKKVWVSVRASARRMNVRSHPKYATLFTKKGAVYVRTYDYKIRLTITFKAPAVGNYSAFTASKTYKL